MREKINRIFRTRTHPIIGQLPKPRKVAEELTEKFRKEGNSRMKALDMAIHTASRNASSDEYWKKVLESLSDMKDDEVWKELRFGVYGPLRWWEHG